MIRKLFLFLFLAGGLSSFAQEDLSITQAIEKALENNYQIKLVKANLDVSKQQNSWGMAGMSPTFSLNLTNAANLTDNTNNPATFFPGVVFNDNFSPSLDMSWTVFNGFGIRIKKERFEQLEEQTKGNAIVVIETTIYDVIIAYYSALLQDRKLDITRDLLNYSQDKLKYFHLKGDLGLSTSLDVLEFENLVLTDSSNLILQELNYKNALRNLNLVMGEDVENQYQLTDLMEFDVPKATYGELREYMFANNQNLKNQFINFELQELNVQGQKSALYPMVSLNLGFTPSVGYIQSFGENEMSISTNSINYSGSVSVRYTLFNGLQRKRNIEIAKIQQQIAGLQIEELQLSMSHQLRSVFELYQTQSQIEDMSLRKVHHAKLLWDLGKDKYDGGLINVFNLNDIRVSYQQARLNYYDRLFDLLKTHYDLLRLTGTIAQEYKAESQLEEE